MRQFLLSDGWRLKQRDGAYALADDFATTDGWIPASAPGTVHQDLMAAGRIPDPFVGLNEDEVQWAGEADWLYRCAFELPDDFAGAETIDLCCDGLDTFATIWLNGTEALRSDNMFVPRRVPAKHLLRTGRNELRILFEPALRRGREREAAHGALAVWNGDASRVYVRKAQYHYGWDWGPCLLTAGPWRVVRLEAYTARIAALYCPVDVAADLSSATLPVEVTLAGDTSEAALRFELIDPAGTRVDSVTLPAEGGTGSHSFELDAPELWWPRGYGQQALYTLHATLYRGERVEDRRELRLGLRRLRLVQELVAGEPGTSFYFEVNNTPIFCGGANWIPADSFLSRVTPERYRQLIEQAAAMNLVMLRVWGGGIYEEDVFYDLCDEYGLLVWQDFMFACGIYPALDWMEASVRAEAEANITRLRHHPSIALWCGNNEDYAIAESLGIDAIGSDDSRFPAKAIYERLLPDVCAVLDPARPYWPGSPYGGSNSADPTVGDRHTWDVWHGRMAPYGDYPRYAGRFVSEFGMEAFPDQLTINSFAPPEELYPQSRTIEYHNKADGGPRRLAVYLQDTLRVPADLPGYIYATQFVQAEALGAAVRGWRRRWGEPGRRAVAGALVWQLDDCWPVTSWAVVDYALRPKAATYVLRRELAPLAVGLALGGIGVEVWAANGRTVDLAADLVLSAWTLDGRQRGQTRRFVQLPANSSTELGPVELAFDGETVLGAALLVGGEVAARATLWPEPFKYLALPDPGLSMTREGADTLRLRVDRPAKGVLLTAGDGVEWSDNMLDLLPDEERIIKAQGLGETPAQTRWLGRA